MYLQHKGTKKRCAKNVTTKHSIYLSFFRLVVLSIVGDIPRISESVTTTLRSFVAYCDVKRMAASSLNGPSAKPRCVLAYFAMYFDI